MGTFWVVTIIYRVKYLIEINILHFINLNKTLYRNLYEGNRRDFFFLS
jgi:hypothetical protein